MSFRDNLQHLRASRNMTQEQLAMLLGVSRQSVTKWEAEKSYPEMDKLIKICQLFDCSLDDLVTGDLTQRSTLPQEPAAPSGPPIDVCGYDEHMRRFANRMASGVSTILLGVAACVLASEYPLAHLVNGDVLSLTCLFIGMGAGLALLIPSGMEHVEFQRAHPYVEYFYTAEQRRVQSRSLAIAVVTAIAIIFTGVVFAAAFGDIGDGGLAGAVVIACVAAAAFLIIRQGILMGRMDLTGYNREAADELSVDEIRAADIPEAERERLLAGMCSGRSRLKRRTEAVCGAIMMLATIVALVWLFAPLGTDDPVWSGLAGMFWLPWPIGGICCGIVSTLMEAFGQEGR